MKVCFLNATSIKKHIWQFRQAVVSDLSFHVFEIAETRLGSEVDDCHIDTRWLPADIRLLASKRDATVRKYDRNDSRLLLQQFIDLEKEIEERSENARRAHMNNCISDGLGSGKNFWKEMHDLGLIPKASDALRGFMSEELNTDFSNIAISSTENLAESLNGISATSKEGFCLSQVTENDVILAV